MRTETIKKANFINVRYKDVKKRKCRTKQTINGKRFLRETYLSIIQILEIGKVIQNVKFFYVKCLKIGDLVMTKWNYIFIQKIKKEQQYGMIGIQ